MFCLSVRGCWLLIESHSESHHSKMWTTNDIYIDTDHIQEWDSKSEVLNQRQFLDIPFREAFWTIFVLNLSKTIHWSTIAIGKGKTITRFFVWYDIIFGVFRSQVSRCCTLRKEKCLNFSLLTRAIAWDRTQPFSFLTFSLSLANNTVCGVVGLEDDIDRPGRGLNIHMYSCHTVWYFLVLLTAPYDRASVEFLRRTP